MSLSFLDWIILAASPSKPPPPTLQEQITQRLLENPAIALMVALFSIASAVLFALYAFTDKLDKYLAILEKRGLKESLSDKQIRLRKDLINAELEQVNTRFEDSLHHKIRIDLRSEEQLQRLSHFVPMEEEKQGLFELIVGRFLKPQRSQDSSERIDPKLSTFELMEREDIQGRLLILGEPGAGKTNELLATVQSLLQKAMKSPDLSFPVIFELSAWKLQDDEGLEDWLISQLRDKHNVPAKVSEQWIESSQLIPCLDGLDELRRVDDIGPITSEVIDEKRQVKQLQCLRAINCYLDTHPGSSMMVCCRLKEYEALEKYKGEQLKSLQGAIYLKDIADDQIQGYLRSNKRDSLWSLLEDNDPLLSLVRKPLFLLMLVVAYQGQSIQSEEELIDLYIQKQLYDGLLKSAYPPSRKPTPEKTERYLSWLATRLEKEEVTEFLIERLQPHWLEKKSEKIFFRLSLVFSRILIFALIYGVGCAVAFVLALIVWTRYELLNVPNILLMIGLVPVLSSGLGIGLFFGSSHSWHDVQLREEIIVHWNRFIKTFLIVGPIFGMTFWLFFRLMFDLSLAPIGGMIFGLIFGLLFGLIRGLSFNESDIYEKKTLNQGLTVSLKRGVNIGLIGGLISGLSIGLGVGLIFEQSAGQYFGLIVGLGVGLTVGLGVGMTAGLQFGLFPVIQHISLRFILWISGYSPWNYAKFLDHAEKHRFIQRVGGRYRFIHDRVRKRFAQRYKHHM